MKLPLSSPSFAVKSNRTSLPQVLDDEGKKQRFRKVIVKQMASAAGEEYDGREGTMEEGMGRSRPKAWTKTKLRISQEDLRSGKRRGRLLD